MGILSPYISRYYNSNSMSRCVCIRFWMFLPPFLDAIAPESRSHPSAKSGVYPAEANSITGVLIKHEPIKLKTPTTRGLCSSRSTSSKLRKIKFRLFYFLGCGLIVEVHRRLAYRAFGRRSSFSLSYQFIVRFYPRVWFAIIYSSFFLLSAILSCLLCVIFQSSCIFTFSALPRRMGCPRPRPRPRPRPIDGKGCRGPRRRAEKAFTYPASHYAKRSAVFGKIGTIQANHSTSTKNNIRDNSYRWERYIPPNK
jgi:hypothetical protein